MPGPLRPRWVKSRSSRKVVRALPVPQEMPAGSAMPDSAANGAQACASKVSGTSAGRGAITPRPNCCATFRPKSVAPMAGTGRPPVAMTRRGAATGPASVSSSKRGVSPLLRRMPCTPQGWRRTTPPASPSRSSIAMMSSALWSQKSWPLCFSWKAMRWRCTSAMKSAGV